MSLSDCPKCWDTPCTCGYEWHHPNYQRILRSAGIPRPRKPLELTTLSRCIFEQIRGMKCWKQTEDAQDRAIEIAQAIILEFDPPERYDVK